MHGDSPVVSGAIVVAGILTAILFVRRELRSERPVMPVDLLKKPVIALSAIGGMAAFIASMTLMLSLPFRLENEFGFSPGVVGTIISPWGLTMLVVAPLAGQLSDRYPAGLLGGIGMALAIAGLLSLAFLPAHPDRIDIVWRMVLTGAGFGTFASPNVRQILGSAPRERTAAAGGLVSTARLTGQTIGATVAAALLAAGIGSGPTPALVAAGLATFALLCSIARLNPAIRRPDSNEVRQAEAGLSDMD